jgi:hypothetical protein
MYRSPVDDSLMVVGRSVVVVSRETRERERARRDRKEYREQGGSSRPSLGDAVIEMEWYKLHATFQLDPTTTVMPRTISTITTNIL